MSFRVFNSTKKQYIIRLTSDSMLSRFSGKMVITVLRNPKTVDYAVSFIIGKTR
jgi:hypothetical protein